MSLFNKNPDPKKMSTCRVPILGYPNKGDRRSSTTSSCVCFRGVIRPQGVDSASPDSKNAGVGSRSSSKSPEQSQGTSTPLHLHQRLGILSLSRPYVTSTANISACNTSCLELDVGTFCPNQYISLYPIALHLGQTRNTNSLDGSTKHR
jgi:hypothetical protein